MFIRLLKAETLEKEKIDNKLNMKYIIFFEQNL